MFDASKTMHICNESLQTTCIFSLAHILQLRHREHLSDSLISNLNIASICKDDNISSRPLEDIIKNFTIYHEEHAPNVLPEDKTLQCCLQFNEQTPNNLHTASCKVPINAKN